MKSIILYSCLLSSKTASCGPREPPQISTFITTLLAATHCALLRLPLTKHQNTMACNVACGTAGTTCNAACVTPPTRSDDDVRCAAYASELGVNEQKRLRVLCLHSFRTNAKILDTQLML